MNSSNEMQTTEKKQQPRREEQEFYRPYSYRRPWMTGVLVAVLIVALLGVFLLAKRFDKTRGVVNQPAASRSVQASGSSVRIEIPFFDQEQYLVGSAVIRYVNEALPEDTRKTLASYGIEQPWDTAYPVNLEFEITGLPVGYQLSALRVEVSEDKAFSILMTIPLTTEDRAASIENLKTGTQYYYRIVLTLSNGSEVLAQGSFLTADTPRLLNVEGIVNTRDFGGWKTQDGKMIRQGLLYRGSEMDGNSDETCKITENGKNMLVNVLGVKTQLDLRWNVQDNPLGEDVEHRSYSTAAYENIFTPDGEKNLRKLFADLADPAIYPAYIHCTHGINQTGTACGVLGMLLGMSEEDVIRSYELSALYSGTQRASFQTMIDTIKQQPGETLAQQTEAYLLSIGVIQEEIDSIRQIFVVG